jgi:hypothetical protein
MRKVELTIRRETSFPRLQAEWLREKFQKEFAEWARMRRAAD